MASTLEGLKTSLSSPSKTVIIVGVVLVLGVLILIAGGIMLGIGIHKSNQKEYIYITNEPGATNTPPASGATQPASGATQPASGATQPTAAGTQSTTIQGSGTATSQSPGTGTGSTASTPSSPQFNLNNTQLYSPIVADILILLDISSATDASIVSDINGFFQLTFEAFDVITGPNSQGGIHFAIIRIPGDTGWGVALVAADFNTVTSRNLLQMAMNNAAADPFYDPPASSGQLLLNQALNLIQDPNFKIDRGYRGTIQNHLAIYVTTNSTPSSDDIKLAQTLRNNKVYQFVALAYKSNGSNINALTQFVGGSDCVLQASNAQELNNTVIAHKLASKILAAWNNTSGDYQCNTS